MIRPIFEGIKFGDSIDLIAVNFGARQNAEFVSGPDECNRNHEGAGELEGASHSCTQTRGRGIRARPHVSGREDMRIKL